MTLYTGDCLDVMPTLDAESVDVVVTDPPYGLAFMGKHWDHGVPAIEFWEAMLRVAKPSAYLLAFGGTRTVHRMACAIEDAGWIIRDLLVWAYASGFPKSKASLKPAWEPIVMARKPGPLRPLAIDACRIGPAMTDAEIARSGKSTNGAIYGDLQPVDWKRNGNEASGRWPANLILTDPLFDGDTEGVVGGTDDAPGGIAVHRNGHSVGGFGGWAGKLPPGPDGGYGDSGTYSRFFLIPKADRSDREPLMGGLPLRELMTHGQREQGPLPKQTPQGPIRRANSHPTVKPVDLMRHLVRLVTPSGGVVLDPFGGSGTTAIACENEGFDWILIEREAEYVAIAEARLQGVQRGLGLVG